MVTIDKRTVAVSIGGDDPQPINTELVAKSVVPAFEYVAGNNLSWYAALAQSLPWSLDDLSRDFGVDIYERMLLDPQLRSLVNVLKSQIMPDGPRLLPAISDEADPNFDAARDMTRIGNRMLNNLERSITQTISDLLECIALGHRIAEITYGVETVEGRSMLQIRKIAVKPRNSIAFVTDPYMNVVGYLARIPGEAQSVQRGTIISSENPPKNLLPPWKFATLSFRPRNDDPRGTSALRCCFKAWNMKNQLHGEYLKYLTQFASPSLIGYAPENARPYKLFDEAGNEIGSRTPAQDMVQTLEAFANGTVTAFPFSARVQWIEMQGEGGAYQVAYALLDSWMAKAVLNQTLATEQSEHQARAAATTHKDVMDAAVRQIRRDSEENLQNQIINPWVELNWGPAAVAIAPRISLGGAEEENKAQLWAAAAQLSQSGYLSTSQMAELDQMLGLPERQPESQLPGTEGEKSPANTQFEWEDVPAWARTLLKIAASPRGEAMLP